VAEGGEGEDPNGMSMDEAYALALGAAAAGAGDGGGGEEVGGGRQGGGVHPRVQGGPAAAAPQLHLQLHPDAQAARFRRRRRPAAGRPARSALIPLTCSIRSHVGHHFSGRARPCLVPMCQQKKFRQNLFNLK